MPDLRLLAAEPTDAERSAIDAVVGIAEVSDGRVARSDRTRRHLLLPALRAAQRRVGWVSGPALGYACRRLEVPPAEAYGVASFYALIALEERPADVLHVCTDLSCRLAGAVDVPEGAQPSPCLGLCERAPASLRTIAGPEPREEQLPPFGPALPQFGQQGLRLLRRIAAGVDPDSLDAYRAAGGYSSLRRAVELGPEGVMREVSESKLLGRGGAAFPTGTKWQAVAHQVAQPHYLVCNADESEPGTFKDRVLMEGDPFALVEAMTIAAYATGCEHGYVYVRAEYPLAHERLENAFAQARAHGFLGDDVMGDGFAFDLELRIGAGAYVCGEETALFQSIEGYRGEPRNKPPFPVEVGLFGKPTVVNNVETLFNVLDVVSDTGTAYAQTGTEGSAGTRLFCLSGHVERPGLYEVPFGTSLQELLDLAGARPPKAVLLGGAAGTFLRPDQLDLKLTFEDARAAGATLGSGVVIVYDESADLVDAVLRIAEFFRDESCGQCVPCRVGTVRQEEALHRLVSGKELGNERAVLADLAQVMRDASICGLGQTAASAVESAMMNLGVLAQ
ncbi:MAG TPA: NADH-ubiquinone oxidoreductase-F iron-sulfur binding region domain-containing protein [Gaiellaceae bacterium]|nr:NADH-ubiquinone oxidoreductase-F iron-sulfur binding region domain-containing protein [Gaiellaceae bacterium]